jgi:tight adherence protein B
MKWILTALFLTTSILLFATLLQWLLLSNRRMENRLKRYLELNDRQKLGRSSFNLLVQISLYKRVVREKVLSKKRGSRLSVWLARAGVPMRPEEYVMFQWICAALAGGLLLLFTMNKALLVLGLIGGYFVPRIWVSRKEKERMASFEDSLQDMITTLIGSLRAGFSFLQALKTVSDEAGSPMKEETETVLREMQYGATLEEALGRWKERMPSEDLDLMIQAILIQRQVGGNLAVVLEAIVQTIRDRNKIQRQVKTLTAQGRLSGIVIGLLPIVLGILLYLISPDYIGVLFHNTVGLIMLVCGGFLAVMGLVFIRKLTKVEV